MDTLCLDDIKKLIRVGDQPRVSIFMPTHQKGADGLQDPIRLKNLLRTAQEKLVARDIKPGDARLMLKPVESLLTDSLFWQQQSNGMALFIEPNMYMIYHLPVVLKEEVGVADRYYVKPLIPLLSACGMFYVLAISQDQVRLLQCTAYGQSRVNLGDTPKNIDDALRLDVRDRVTGFHSGDSMSPSGLVQSGPPSLANFIKDNMPLYLGRINKGVEKILKSETAPLILAGVDYLHPIYRKINTYRNLFPECIAGSQDKVADADLREKAWKIVQPGLDAAKMAAIEDFKKFAGTGLTANGFEEVIKAAAEGRVRFLFIAEDAQQWGTYNSDDNTVSMHSGQNPEDTDLVDLAAFLTLSHDGTVYMVRPDEVPGEAAMTAILRF